MILAAQAPPLLGAGPFFHGTVDTDATGRGAANEENGAESNAFL